MENKPKFSQSIKKQENKKQENKKQEKKRNIVAFEVDDEVLKDFCLSANGKTKATLARYIVTEYFTKYKKLENDNSIYFPKKILTEIYNSVDPKRKEKIISAIENLTLDKMNVKSYWDEDSLIYSLKRWFCNNNINFENETDKNGNKIISSLHDMGPNFSEITVESFERVLRRKNVTCEKKIGPNYFRVTIINKPVML